MRDSSVTNPTTAPMALMNSAVLRIVVPTCGSVETSPVCLPACAVMGCPSVRMALMNSNAGKRAGQMSSHAGTATVCKAVCAVTVYRSVRTAQMRRAAKMTPQWLMLVLISLRGTGLTWRSH
ncbi:hypothetical protein DPMN_129164 [Dreissena polymorpha]|uniref:Uncharacterized protein n=1 Tax=Dreissena polymorpha TaxID=45954 RepID=A0A9D4H591_DREPO|nr:hypothetical protein DPMN_129164 [Dreissena polymorpha]